MAVIRSCIVYHRAQACRGLPDALRAPPYLLQWEAEFIAAKRKEGVSDANIAKMLDCTVGRLDAKVKGPDLTPDDIARQQEEARQLAGFWAREKVRQERRTRKEEDVYLAKQRRARLRGENPQR